MSHTDFREETTKYAFRNDPNIRTVVGTRTGSINHTGLSTSPRKKSKRRKSIGVIAITVKTIAGTTSIDRQTGVATFTGRVGSTGSTESNADMTKARMTIGIQRRARRNPSHPDRTGDLSKIRTNQRTDTYHHLLQKRTLAYDVSCATNSDTMQHNVRSGKVKVRPSTQFRQIFNK